MELEGKTLEELKAIAKELDIKVHHLAKEKSIISQINKQQAHRVEAAQDKIVQKEEKASQPAITNTEDDVVNAIQHITGQKPEFKAIFPDDGTWIFQYRGAEESGNLNIPLRVIVMKANNVARGRRALRTMGREASDQTYAGNILTV